ncbi:MAG TPA: alcohol dehydrogenase catalytic domain-containing protein [Candidatus Dormibacteraeota bacterium]|jgi:threonine dehydrogenase-like Zn-dependent dehydrogenase|nr:alcohol dehydrogenase catalytic domain-containing protein [Candidatus Dormibacteraeota bacterium]
MRLDEIAIPVIGAGEALLQVLRLQPSITEVVGLGGSGLGAGQIAQASAAGNPLQLFGHEFSGRVIAVKAPSYGLGIGDRVGSLGRIPCGQCRECRGRRARYCSSGEMLGITRPGCFAEMVAVPTKVLARIPDNVSDEEAATLQPLASMTASLRGLAPAIRGGGVAVLGLGLMGLLAVQVLAAYGAARVIGVSSRRQAVEACRELGIEAHHLPTDASLLRRLDSCCQAVIDCSGMAQLPGLARNTAGLAADLARPGGTIVQVALYTEPLLLDTAPLKRKCVTYQLPQFSTRSDLSMAASMVSSGQVRVKPLLTRAVHGLDQLPLAFEMTLAKSSEKLVGPIQVEVSG